jgi:hypothetical protein
VWKDGLQIDIGVCRELVLRRRDESDLFEVSVAGTTNLGAAGSLQSEVGLKLHSLNIRFVLVRMEGDEWMLN